ncbi:penicillin-binding transpeptidase domain-containing protein, partial [Staphylococcus aureus]
AWRLKQGKPWNLGDTVVHGIGQGFLQLTPLSLCTMVARIATGRAVQPHLTRAIGEVVQIGVRADDWPPMGLPERELHAVREGMWAVVNDPAG